MLPQMWCSGDRQKKKTTGSMLSVEMTCLDGHITNWVSQPINKENQWETYSWQLQFCLQATLLQVLAGWHHASTSNLSVILFSITPCSSSFFQF